MKLVRISHDRCGEYDSQDFMLAPEGWSDNHIKSKISEAVEAHIAEAKKSVADLPRVPPFPNYDAHPDKTVVEVKKLHLAAKAEYQRLKDIDDEHKKNFSQRLTDLGFIPLWARDADVIDVHANWGHNHGVDLRY